MSDGKTAHPIVVAGGGTGGHLYTGIALLESWSDPQGEIRLSPDAFHFVGGTYGLDREILPRYPFPHTLIDVQPFGGRTFRQKGVSVWKLVTAYFRSVLLLKHLKTSLVIGVGGYVSVPVLLAAWRLRIPRIIIEQNAIPGRANRLLGKIADRVFIQFREAARYFSAHKVIVSGNPMRPSLRKTLANHQKRDNRSAFTVLVLGGSQGAHAINRLIEHWTAELPKDSALRTISIIHQTGKVDFERMQAHYASLDWRGPIDVQAFLDPIAPHYQAADLVISRSGAGTVCELAASGKASILIPYPYAADNHQFVNARALEAAGATQVLAETEASPERLHTLLENFFRDRNLLAHMGERAKTIDFPNASTTIWRDCQAIRKP